MSTDASGDGRPAAERLRELQRLRDDGLISDEEFEAQRARILDEAFGPGQTEMASGTRADGPDGSDADAPSDEGAASSPLNDQPKPDPPGESVVNPARWTNWLRITTIVLSGIWIVTIPFMFWRAARYTWLPYLGVATAVVLVLSIAVGVEGDEEPGVPAAPSPRAVATAATRAVATGVPARTPTPLPTSARTPPPESTPEPRCFTGCVIGDRVSVGSLDLKILSVEAYDSSRHNYLNDANVRVEVVAVNSRSATDSEYTIDSSYFRLVDENGIAHDVDWLCTDCPDQISYIHLVRGGRVRGYVYFTIPEGRRLVELIYEPLFSRNNARIRVPQPASAPMATPAARTSTPEAAHPHSDALTLPEGARPPEVVWVHLTYAGSDRTGLDVASRGGLDDLGRISVTVGRPYHGIQSFGRPTSMLRSDETYEGWGYLDFDVLISSETLVTVQWGSYGEDEPIEIDYVCTGPETTYREHGAPGAGGIWECSLP